MEVPLGSIDEIEEDGHIILPIGGPIFVNRLIVPRRVEVKTLEFEHAGICKVWALIPIVDDLGHKPELRRHPSLAGRQLLPAAGRHVD